MDLLFGACEPASKRPLGDECASGSCSGAVCLDPQGDEDQDGLTNLLEQALGTDPFDPASDADQAGDLGEVGSDPTRPPDSDGDGLTDVVESAIDDIDGDCIPDQLDAITRDESRDQVLRVCPIHDSCAELVQRMHATCSAGLDGAPPSWTCDLTGAPAIPSSDLTCDGVGDDCDGDVDEDWLEQTTTCGVGVCAGEGGFTCESGEIWDMCTAGAELDDDAECNARDDDCDGTADDGWVAPATTCGVGPCAASGVRACGDGALEDTCAPRAAGVDDDCDGVDDDCDGATDENFESRLTTCGEGACGADGVTSCVLGMTRDGCAAGPPDEPDDVTCDGVDGDCAGETDEDYESQATVCGTRACAGAGVTSCVVGAVEDSCQSGSDADCDQNDDDCPGATDEGNVPVATSCRTGACKKTGITSCNSNGVVDSFAPGAPAANDTTCDGVDNDCANGTDEDDAPTGTTCGTGACASSGQLMCLTGDSNDDTCEPLAPNCTGRVCGGDGRGGSCGTCAPPAAMCLGVSCNGGGQCGQARLRGLRRPRRQGRDARRHVRRVHLPWVLVEGRSARRRRHDLRSLGRRQPRVGQSVGDRPLCVPQWHDHPRRRHPLQLQRSA